MSSEWLLLLIILLIVFVNLPLVGYFLFDVRLLKIRAVNSSIIEPARTGDKTYIYPSAFIFSEPITAIKAVAPPGGCRVLVICIHTMERETAKGAVNQITSGNTL